MRRAAVLTVSTLLLVAGCGGSSKTSAPSTSTDAAVSTAATTAAAATSTSMSTGMAAGAQNTGLTSASASTSSPAPIPSATSTPKLGATQTLTNSDVTISFTASDYSARLAGANAELLPSGDRIATIMVKACLKSSTDGGPVAFTWNNWSMLFADGTTALPLHAWSQTDFPSALYPNDENKPVPVGECRAGLIPFDIVASQTADPVKIVYGVDATTFEWNR